MGYDLAMDLKELIKEYFVGAKHMQLATVNKGQPWICTVYFATDENNNLYWTSGRSRQHSIEINNNSKVAATIVKDGDRKQALQISGEAFEVDANDLERVHALYQDRFGPKDYDLKKMRQHEPEGRAYWVLKPSKIMFWDEVNFPNQPKQNFDWQK